MERLSSQTELAELYSAADVFVNPSREETMGLTTVEALACGTPAVVYNSTAVPEVVDEKSGIVVQAGDVDALYQAVMACNLRGEDALARGRMFSLERQNASFLKLYHRLIRENDRMR
jgi:glycosyltransferase involved in cell wall biosynthesis